MNSEADKVIEEIERRGQFIAATYEAERLCEFVTKMQDELKVVAQEVAHFRAEMERKSESGS